ncbi:MAG: asparagine synthase (glutamine-hydrolyzing) [Planctomycetes bacterium]|nr:asparagine synthase (glutamine-hydrolyzing) [Planctomycetota bacterium]
MCGIAGIVRTDGRPVDRAALARMAARLVHRGPDQEGFWPPAGAASSGQQAIGSPASAICAGLAVRRLAVIDPPGSRQPIANEDGSAVLACNGEIYNYLDLRAALAARGHAFRTAGDAEPLVHLYDDFGEAFLERLVGMFALAVWDARQGRLLLARDRLGQKPLYWFREAWGLAFASEPAALLECPDVPRSLDRRAVGAYLRFGCVPAPATGFAGVRKLPPAHYLVFDAASGRLHGPARYWEVPRGPADAAARPAEWRERLRAALAQACGAQLAADVPLGVLLSGGLDSSIVAALAAAHAPGRLRTFTVRFAEAGWDESPYARAVAARLGTEHTEIAVEPRCLEALPELVRHHGEPFADSSNIAMYYLAREARRHVTVALSGDGGDESFGGYPRHAAMWMSERIGPAARRVLGAAGRLMPPRPGRKSRWNALRRFLAALDLEPLQRCLAWRSLFDEGGLRALLAPDFAAEALADDPLGAWREALAGLESRPWTDRAMAIDLADYLPNDCLAKVDIASMRHGLEVRSPMLDHRVVELARRMPLELKWRARAGRTPQGKAVLREAFADLLPAEVVSRGKMGFGVPVSDWLAGEHAEWMRSILLDPGARSRAMLNRPAALALIASHAARRADHGERLWSLVCLELWLRTFRL